jgi:hypothetical protein
VEPEGFVAMGVNYLCVSMQNSTCITEYALFSGLFIASSPKLYLAKIFIALVSYTCYNFFHSVLNLSTLGTKVPFFHINENAQIFFIFTEIRKKEFLFINGLFLCLYSFQVFSAFDVYF